MYYNTPRRDALAKSDRFLVYSDEADTENNILALKISYVIADGATR